ncbi:MAG: T9SS type A sorting domain-containing protein [Sphingobacteriales bacterium]|nr:MAG: T9SS type A sorting domain-containing protein [Sphingobacteriales bacterium]
MKKLLLFLFILLCNQVNAQQDFIRPGAQWYYDMQYGSLRQYVYSDTTIRNTACKRIRMDASIDSLYFYYGLRMSQPGDKFVYSSNDTVYIYNKIFKRFTPLYVFNVQAGDTITLPVVPSEDGGYMIPKGDSTFSLIIDSVKTVLYDTVLLKTVFVRPDSSKPDNMMDYGRYIWNIGTPYGLLPTCISDCAFILGEPSSGPSGIRCYTDDRLSLKLTTGNCQRGVSLDVSSAKQSDNTISIHPNPATDKVFITNISNAEISEATIVSLDGRTIRRYNNEINEGLTIADLPAGTYLIRIQAKDGQALIKKLVITR